MWHWQDRPVVPTAQALAAQPRLQEIQRTVAATNRPIPLAYGRLQLAGDVYVIWFDEDTGLWTVGYRFCLGEAEEFEEILVDGGPAPEGMSINTYLGTTAQGVDPLLAAAVPDYADTLVASTPGGDIGIVHLVAQYSNAVMDHWPEILVTLKAKKVYNPTTGTTVYSDTFALFVADLIVSPIYGLNASIDWDSVEDVQDANEDTTPGEARRQGFLLLDRAEETETWLETARAYASCFIVWRGDTVYLVPDRPASAVMTIGPEDHLGPPIITHKDTSGLPTVIRVQYTDTSTTIWQEALSDPAIVPGATEWRESVVHMPGITRHSEAYREAVERLNKLTLLDLDIRWPMKARAQELEDGDVVNYAHPYLGTLTKQLRVARPREDRPGRWDMRGVEYDAAAYSDDVITTPSTPDGNLPNGGRPPAPSTLVAEDDIYQLETGKWASRMRLEWAAVPNAAGYTVTVKRASQIVWGPATVRGTKTATGPLQEEQEYAVEVSAFNVLRAGDPIFITHLMRGKAAVIEAMPDVPTGLRGFEAGGDVRLWWQPSQAFDVERYEIRYGSTGGSWSAATVLGRPDDINFTSKTVPVGTWRFYVKSMDSIGQYSDDAVTIDIVVTRDDDAYLAGELNCSTALTTYMHSSVLRPGVTRYISDGNDTWDSTFPAVMNTYVNPLPYYQTPQGTSEWLSDALDVSQIVSGDWQAYINVTVIAGAASIYLGLSDDDVTYTWSTDLAQKGRARYARILVQSTGIFMVDVGDNDDSPNIRVDVKARSEDGQDTSAASGATTITLDGEYSGVKSIVITPEGTAARSYAVDNVVLGDPTEFDVYIFNAAGTQVANSFRWSFKGV